MCACDKRAENRLRQSVPSLGQRQTGPRASCQLLLANFPPLSRASAPPAPPEPSASGPPRGVPRGAAPLPVPAPRTRLPLCFQRTQTLLKEYKERDKSNLFIDKRLGEYNSSISAEEKMMRRFALEQQVRHMPAGAQGGPWGRGRSRGAAGGRIRQPEGSAGLCPRVFAKALAPARVGHSRGQGRDGPGPLTECPEPPLRRRRVISELPRLHCQVARATG